MPDHFREVYAGEIETKIKQYRNSGKNVNAVLLGTWLGVMEETNDGWLHVKTVGEDGWVREEHTRPDSGLKVFFVDVGQGDGVLIETPSHRFLVDGGPNKNLLNYLKSWKYKWLIKSGHQVHFDAIFISHFDYDHFNGLKSIIENPAFTVDAIYHNGIARFHEESPKRHDKYDTDLGTTEQVSIDGVSTKILKTTFDDIDSARTLVAEGGLMFSFNNLLEAIITAHDEGRVSSLKRLTVRDDHVPNFGPNGEVHIQVLGPIPSFDTGRYKFNWFKDSSHTRNGHSIVLKVNYGSRSVLLGGDLNTDSEEYLLQKYGGENPFRVDVAKSCHHGASEFLVEFMDKVSPYATVISSGDNENYAHPRADAVGCAGKYSRGERPLVLSTELARSIKSGKQVHYGMIHVRSDGTKIGVAQMLEKRRAGDLWDSYEISIDD